MTKRKLIKLGGSVFEQLDPRYYEEWNQWLAKKNELIILHGGGPALSAYCRDMNIKAEFNNGIRVTTEQFFWERNGCSEEKCNPKSSIP